MTIPNKPQPFPAAKMPSTGSPSPKLPPIHAPKSPSTGPVVHCKPSPSGSSRVKHVRGLGSDERAHAGGCPRRRVTVLPKALGQSTHAATTTTQADAHRTSPRGCSSVAVKGCLQGQGKTIDDDDDKTLSDTTSTSCGSLKGELKATASSTTSKPLGRALPNDPEQSLKSLALRSFKAKRAAKVEETAVVKEDAEGCSTETAVVRPKVGSGYGLYTDAWSKDSMLGRGSFGAVYKCTNLRTGAKVAVKQVVVQSEEMLLRMIDEVLLMCRASFRNNHVVECFGWSVSHDLEATKEVHVVEELRSLGCDHGSGGGGGATGSNEINALGHLDRVKAIGNNFNIVMECVDQGSLSSLLKQSRPLKQTSLRQYLKQLLIGLRSLHAAGIAHRDIKCQNLLLTADNTLKVADFGCAKRASHSSKSTQLDIEGSIPWMAPEVVNPSSNKQVSTLKSQQGVLDMWKKADVWAIGCTVIEMATGKPPWNTFSNPASAMYAIATCKQPPQAPASLNPQGKDFVRACLQLDPKRRPTVAVLCFHDYIKSAPS